MNRKLFILKQEQVGAVLQRLYDNEINVKIDWFWDEGFSWKIGDDLNGHKILGKEIHALFDNSRLSWSNIEHSVSALAYAVAKLFPESKFQNWYNSLIAHSIPKDINSENE